MKQRFPLRRTVPALIFVVGTMLIIGYFLAEYSALTAKIRKNGRESLSTYATLTAGELESAFRRGDTRMARAAIERLGGARALTTVALTTGDGTVIFGSQPGYSGIPISTLLYEGHDIRIDAIMSSNGIHIATDARGLRQVGFFPVLIRGNLGDILPEQTGWLVLGNDLTFQARQSRYELMWHTVPYALTLLALSIGLWWLFRVKLLYRIQELGDATRAIAMGDFSAVPDIGGSDELHELSVEFAQMARRLQENTAELTFLSGHDRLTGLHNRRALEQKLNICVREARNLHARFLLMYIDIDSFRVINDTQGHEAGDALIMHFADRLQELVTDADMLARIGGDEFAVILSLDEGAAPEERVNSLHKTLTSLPFRWRNVPFHIQVSIGVSVVDGASAAAEVLSRADAACYTAKDRGRNRVQLWRDDEQSLLERHGQMKWVSRIQSALETNRFELHGQPIKSLSGKDPGLHFEILLRMRDEDNKMAAPGEFLLAAERFQLSAQIDRWVIEHTFKMIGELGKKARGISTCAINLSGLSLDSQEILGAIQQGFSDHPNIRPNQLCFEITETAAITNLHTAVGFIEELRGMDCRIALDDFGSGVSSFGYLKNLPVDIIKIDGMFVRDILESPLDHVITRSINDIAHSMGKRTIAEFAETTAIINALRALGVDFVQGYGVARPMPLRQLFETGLAQRETG